MSSEEQALALARMMVDWNELKRETAAIAAELDNRSRAVARFAAWLANGEGLPPHIDPLWASADAAMSLKRELAEKRAELARIAELLKPMGWHPPS
jgi:hypothetical protein